MSTLKNSAVELPPLGYDSDMDRHYVPLPGGWEIQTKGKGSSFRIAHAPSGRRWIVMDDQLHDPLVAMANAARAAITAAAPVGEPVAWLKEWDSVGRAQTGIRLVDLSSECETWLANMFPKITPLYAAPVPAAAPKAALTLSQIAELGSQHLEWDGRDFSKVTAFARAVESASGPNAALVAALKLAQVHVNIHGSDEEIVAVGDALTAAGAA